MVTYRTLVISRYLRFGTSHWVFPAKLFCLFASKKLKPCIFVSISELRYFRGGVGLRIGSFRHKPVNFGYKPVKVPYQQCAVTPCLLILAEASFWVNSHTFLKSAATDKVSYRNNNVKSLLEMWMSRSKRVKHQDHSDQELLDLYARFRDRQAVAELYERYRGLVGNYLYREINNKEIVTDIFNSMMLELVSASSSHSGGSSVSIQLFTKAYANRRRYLASENKKKTLHAASKSSQSINKLSRMIASLPSLHRDIIELAYKYNFTIDEIADIIGRKTSVVENCLSHVKSQHMSIFGISNTPIVAIEDYRSPIKARC